MTNEERGKKVKWKKGNYCPACEDSWHIMNGCQLCYGKCEAGQMIRHFDTVSVSENGTEYDVEHVHEECWKHREEFYKKEAEMYDKLGREMDAEIAKSSETDLSSSTQG